jgi:hypothetical protein
MHDLSDAGHAVRIAPTQRGFWFLHFAYSRSTEYNVCVTRIIKAELDATALRRAIDLLSIRQEALLLRFILVDIEPCMIVDRTLTVPLAVCDYSKLPDQDRAVKDELERFSALRFDLEKGPAARIMLILKEENESILSVAMHHIICDGLSTEIFFEELLEIYDAYVTARRLQLAPMRLTYTRFAVLETSRLDGEAVAKQENWASALRFDAAPANFKGDLATGHSPSNSGALVSFLLDTDSTLRLDHICRRSSASRFMVLVALVKVILYRDTGESLISIGSPILNRKTSDLMCVIGCFANTVVLQTSLSGQFSFEKLIRLVKQKVCLALENHDIPLEQIVRLENPVRSATGSPLFNVLVTYHSEKQLQRSNRVAHRLRQTSLRVNKKTARYNVSIDVYPRRNGSLAINFEYRTELYSANRIAEIFGALCKLVENVFEAPHLSIGE